MLTQQPLDGQVLDFVPLWRGSPFDDVRQLEPADRKALRGVAAGLGSVRAEPGLRQRAIAALGRLRTVEDLNMLSTLARSDPDLRVRVAALSALSQTALAMAAPVLRDALMSGDAEERGAAERGLIWLTRDIGTRAVLDALKPPVGVGRLVRSAEALLNREQQKRASGARPCRVRSDPR